MFDSWLECGSHGIVAVGAAENIPQTNLKHAAELTAFGGIKIQVSCVCVDTRVCSLLDSQKIAAV